MKPTDILSYIMLVEVCSIVTWMLLGEQLEGIGWILWNIAFVMIMALQALKRYERWKEKQKKEMVIL